ncbi:MAG: Tad domain-containing protein [Acidimicrobiia bacterium]|nr:Tad domain-containing protein [Acidimicrobiia bacterium]
MLRWQRGASAVLIAGAMLAIMGIASIAIDYSAAVNERRQDVGSADTAALAGAVELATTGALNPFQATVDEIKAVANANVAHNITNAEWASCADPEALAVVSTAGSLGVTNGSPCISFSADFTKVRVRIPDQDTETTFGRALGRDTITTFAAAEASLGPSFGSSGGFPAGAFSGTAAGSQFCIKSATPGSSDCDTSSTGNFADFQPYFYTNLSPGGIDTTCVSGLAPAPLARAMADGIDHRLGRTDVIRPVGTRVNGASCPGTPGPHLPYQVNSGSGYSNNDITEGLITGGSYDGAYNGRLDRGPYQDAAAIIFGRTIDNRPLWAFIRSGSGLAASCVSARSLPVNPTYTTAAQWDTAKNLMASCLHDETGELFTSTIANSARMTTVPVFHQTGPLGSNACCYDIKGGLPVFIESLWVPSTAPITCSGQIVIDAGSGTCRHDAGMQGTIGGPPGTSRIHAASAFVLRPSHLPGDLAQELGGGNGAVFVKVELTR